MRIVWIVASILMVLGSTAALMARVYWSDVVGSDEQPSDEALIKTLAAHKSQFDQARCGVTGSRAARDKLSALGVTFASCDYDNTLRLGFGRSTLSFAIGPGWAKGLTYIRGDPVREGKLVASTDRAYRLKADVYLRPAGEGWFVWFQRDD